jgi:tetratricopeptide (TPR) repeat protein
MFRKLRETVDAVQRRGYVVRCVNSGVKRMWRGDYMAALRSFDEAIRSDPTVMLTYTNRALCYFDLERYDDAITDAEHVLEQDPNAPSAYVARGLSLIKKGRIADAEQDLARAVELGHNSAIVLGELGNLRRRMNKLDDALANLVAAIRRDPANPELHLVRGRILLRMGDPNAALKDFQYAANHVVDSALSNMYIGEAYEALQDTQQALHHYRIGEKGDPHIISLYYFERAVTYGCDQPDEALRNYDHCIRLQPKMHFAYYNRSNIYRLRQNFSAALADLDTAIRIDVQYACAYYFRSITRFRVGDTESALSDVETMLRLDPSLASGYAWRGYLLQLRGDTDKAAADYAEALRLEPDPYNGYTDAAELHERAGDRVGARIWLKMLLAMQPDHPNAAQIRERLNTLR